MDTNDPGDLIDLERRLSSWKPTTEGLDSEAMLFAAGRAAAMNRAARFIWPALACFMTIVAIALGVWLESEHSERKMLAQQLRQQSLNPAPAHSPLRPSINVPTDSPRMEELSPDSFLAAHRALEHGLESWPPRAVVLADPSKSPFPTTAVFRVGQRDTLLDP